MRCVPSGIYTHSNCEQALANTTATFLLSPCRYEEEAEKVLWEHRFVHTPTGQSTVQNLWEQLQRHQWDSKRTNIELRESEINLATTTTTTTVRTTEPCVFCVTVFRSPVKRNLSLSLSLLGVEGHWGKRKESKPPENQSRSQLHLPLLPPRRKPVTITYFKEPQEIWDHPCAFSKAKLV